MLPYIPKSTALKGSQHPEHSHNNGYSPVFEFGDPQAQDSTDAFNAHMYSTELLDRALNRRPHTHGYKGAATTPPTTKLPLIAAGGQHTATTPVTTTTTVRRTSNPPSALAPAFVPGRDRLEAEAHMRRQLEWNRREVLAVARVQREVDEKREYIARIRLRKQMDEDAELLRELELQEQLDDEDGCLGELGLLELPGREADHDLGNVELLGQLDSEVAYLDSITESDDEETREEIAGEQSAAEEQAEEAPAEEAPAEEAAVEGEEDKEEIAKLAVSSQSSSPSVSYTGPVIGSWSDDELFIPRIRTWA